MEVIDGPEQPKPRRYPIEFWVLCIHMLLFLASFNMLIPELYSYLDKLGGADFKWMILGLWTISAGITRPISGKIADNISRKSVIYIGLICSVAITFLYPIFTTVAGFLILRMLHGFSTGWQPTGATALIADIIPQGRRGEAMGIFGVTFTLGYGLGASSGSLIEQELGMNGLFMVSACMGIVALALIPFIYEDRKIVQNYSASLGNDTFWKKVIPNRTEIFGPEVIVPSVVMYLTAVLAGIYMMTVPDFSEHLGYTNKGYFWFTYMLVTVVTRLVAGKLTDRFGPRKNLFVSCALLIVAATMTANANTPAIFELSSMLYGLGSGIASPALFTWCADLSHPVHKGRGMATMFIALEFGIFTGQGISQYFYANKPDQLDDAYYIGAALCAVALIFLIVVSVFGRRKRMDLSNV
jgi:MFS family permease